MPRITCTAGLTSPTGRSRIPHIKTRTPAKMHRSAGCGNDATKQSSQAIFARYETLLNDIRRRCPDATLVLSKVPPRQGTTRTMTTISEISRHLHSFVTRMDNVCPIDVLSQIERAFNRAPCIRKIKKDLYGLNESAGQSGRLRLRPGSVSLSWNKNNDTYMHVESIKHVSRRNNVSMLINALTI